MRSYHEGKKFSKVLMSIVSVVLCTMIVAMSTLTAFAGSAVDSRDGNILVFNSVDDIAIDQICVLVFGDMTQSGADAEGRSIIGGNLTIDSGWSASVKAKFNNDYALMVGGNIKISGGNLDVGGCLAQSAGSTISGGYNCTNCNNGGSYVHKDTTGWIKAYVSAAEAQFKATSKGYASKAANGTVSSTNWGDFVPGSNHKAGDPHVFYIEGEGKHIAFNMIQRPNDFGDDGIIINVSGKNVTFDGSNFQGGNEDFKRAFNSRIIWNFYEAETLNINGAIQGSVLAPYATLNGRGGHVNGTTIVRNLNGMGGFEYHTGQFFKDPLRADLTVTKKLSDGSTPNDEFNFTLYEQTNSGWTQVDRFSLKAGESKGFSGLDEGRTFKVVEDNSTAYKLLEVTGGSVNSVSERSATFTVSSLSYKVTFTNEASTGAITVKKALNDSVTPNATFSFQLQRENNGSWQDVTGGTFTLGNNGSKTIEGLEYGNYRIVESVDNTIYYTTVNGSETNVTEVAISASNPNPEVTFNNARRTAVLTVEKALQQGDNNNGESFTFQLYKQTSNGWTAEGEAFTLSAGATKEFILPVGVTYKVEETSSGASYQLASSENTQINLLKNEKALFVNAINRTGITVFKTVEGLGGNPDDQFEFTIVGPELNETFYLKDGESKTFENLQPGDEYVITETAMGNIYEFVGIAGGSVNGASTTVAVAEGASATFTNKVRTGSISVNKTLTDTVDPDAKFTFTVKDAAGNIVGTLILGNGETGKIDNLPYGGVYTVTEAVDANSYVTYYYIDNGPNRTDSAVTGNITISGDHYVAFTNERAKASIKITKALAADAINLNETFIFQIYKKVNGEWKAQGGSITLGAGSSQSFTADVGAEYAVVETSTGNSYVLDTVSGGIQTITLDGAQGTSFVASGNNELVFTNDLKKGSIYVYKKLNDSIAPDSSFNFTLERLVNGKWEFVEQIAIQAKQGYQFRNLDYGYQYRVIESVNGNIYTTSYVVNDAQLDGTSLVTGSAIDSGVSATTNGFRLDAEIKAVTFTNTRKTANLTIKKALTETSNNLGENFSFSLEKLVGDEWVDTGRTINLSAGTEVTISGLEVGVSYRIVETSTGKSYNYYGITGVEKEIENGGIITLNSDAEVTVRNAIKTGKIIVGKTVEDTTDPNAKFSFTVYQKVNGQWTQYGNSFQLGNGDHQEISGLPYGGEFKVVEFANSNYNTSYKIAGSTVNATETSEIVINSDSTTVEFTNTRKTAKLTVVKALVDGSAEFDETFNFVLQRLKDGVWTDVETFQLKNGGTKVIDAAVGAEYRVLETYTGESYRFDSVDGGTYISTVYGNETVNGASVKIAADAKITVFNAPKGASLIVRKSLIGNDYNDEFTFDIQKFNGSSYVSVGTLTMKAGESRSVNALLGEDYRIVETNLNEKYALTQINGADSAEVENAYALVKIDGSEDITFVNTVKKGSIKVTKTLNDSLDSDAGFSFKAYKQVGEEWNLIASETLTNGKTWTINDIDYGTVVKIVEEDANNSRYATTNTVTANSGEAIITVDGDETVGFTNTRKSASLVLSKMLAKDTKNVGGSFNFELMVEKDGAWASVCGIQLDAGETKTIDNLKAGATYMLIEKLGDGSKYVLDSYGNYIATDPNGAANGLNNPVSLTNVTYNGEEAVKFTASAQTKTTITAVNKNAAATLTINKEITGEDNKEAFNFVVEKKVGEEFVKFAEFPLSGGQEKILDVVYGDEYRITETITGTNYKLNTVTGADNAKDNVASIVINNAGEKVTYNNKRESASIEVKKLLKDGDNDLGGKFAFELFKKGENGEWESVKTFELGLDESITIRDLVAGNEYLIIEKLEEGSKYELDSVTGGTATAYNGCDGVIVKADSKTVVSAEFTNRNSTPNDKVKVYKKVVGTYNGEKFEFKYSLNGGEDEVFTLGDGEVKVIDVKYGDKVVVTETDDNKNYVFESVDGPETSFVDLDKQQVSFKVTKGGETILYTNTKAKADLTISKKLAAGSNNVGGEFLFDVYHVAADGTETLAASDVKVALNGEAKVTGLEAGEQYKVVEKDSGEAYVCVENNKLITLSPDGENKIEFQNKNANASVTLKKYVDSKYEPLATDTFEFAVKVNGEKVEVENANENGNVVLTAGESFKLDVKYGDKVEFEEVNLSGRYVLAGITGADAVKANVSSLTVDAKEETVIYTNAVKTGSITVEKAIEETVPSGEIFAFTLYRLDSEGNWINTNQTATLGNGGKATFRSLEYGQYKVVETQKTGYTAYYDVDGTGEFEGEGAAKKVNGDDSVIKFINKRNTVKVRIEKTLANGKDISESFKFVLQQLDEKGVWKSIKEVQLTGESISDAIDLEYGATYRVLETETGASFAYSKASADECLEGYTTSDTLGKGYQFVPTGDGTVTIENKLRSTSVEVKKTVAKGSTTEAFSFYYTVNDGEPKFETLKNGQSFLIDVNYNDVVKVYEKTNGSYNLTGVTIAGEAANVIADEEGNSGVVYSVKNDGTLINFTNTIKSGSFTLTKQVFDNYVSDDSSKFQFKVQKLVNAEWVDISEVLYLGNGEYETIEDLDYGTQVRVIEYFNNGSNYNVVYTKIGDDTVYNPSIGESNNIITDSIQISGAEGITVTNTRKTAKLSITKALTNGGDLGDEFTILVERQNANGQGYTTYKTLKLKANKTQTIDIGVGVKYRITETDSGENYVFESVEGQTEYTLTATKENEIQKATVNNTVKKGAIEVEKILVDDVDADAKFTFQLKDASGKVLDTLTGVGNGSKVTFNASLNYGETYTVTEIVNGSTYETTCTLNGEAINTVTDADKESVSTVSITVGRELDHVAFTNTRKTAELTVVKTLKDANDEQFYNALDEAQKEFTFQLQVKSGSAWENVGSPFILGALPAADETSIGNTKQFTDLAVNAEYRVIETKSGSEFVLSGVEGGAMVAVKENNTAVNGVKFTMNEEGNTVGLINSIVRGSLAVKKVIGNTDEYFDSDKEFQFNISGLGVEKNFTVKANGEPVVFSDNLVAGYSYTITEIDTDPKFALSNIQCFDSENNKVDSATTNIEKQSIKVVIPENDSAAAPIVVFTNDVNTGSLAIKKTLNDKAATGSEVFTFVVKDSNGKQVGDEINVKAGETKTVDGLFYGETYTVEEKLDGATAKVYTVQNIVNGGSAADGNKAVITIAQPENTAEFINTRNTSKLTIKKSVSGYMADNEEFYVTVSGIFEDGDQVKEFVITKTGSRVEGSTSYPNATCLKLDVPYDITSVLYGQEYDIKEIGSSYYTVKFNGVEDGDAATKVLVETEAEMGIENLRNTADVTIIKAITGKDEELAYEDTFSFKLEVLEAGEWVEVEDGSFDIVNGENMQYTFTGLACGREYRITETNTGVNYMFATAESSEKSAIVDSGSKSIKFTLADDTDVTFKNMPNTQGLIIRKEVTEVGKEDQLFRFKVYQGSREIDDFSIKANEFKEYPKLPIGDNYRIIEVDTGESYELDSVTVTEGTSYKENTDNGVLTGVYYLKLNADKATEVVFTNKPVVNKLTVSKVITGTSSDEDFNFILKQGETEIPFTLKNGQSQTFDVFNGVEYSVIESQTSKLYKLETVTGADNFDPSAGIATLKIDGDENVKFENIPKTGSIVLSKSVIGFAPKDDTFEFTVKYDNGEAVKSSALNNGKVTLKDGGIVTIDGIEYGKNVIISEKINDKVYTATYTVGETQGEGTETGKITIDCPSIDVDFFNKYEEPVVLAAYSKADFKSLKSMRVSNDVTVKDDDGENPPPPTTEPSYKPTTTTTTTTGTNPPPTTNTSTPPTTTTQTNTYVNGASYSNNGYTSNNGSSNSNVISSNNGSSNNGSSNNGASNNNVTQKTNSANNNNGTAYGAAVSNTGTGTGRQSVVLGASEINAVNTYGYTASDANVGDQIIPRVLGDSDTPQTGDEIPVSVVIALAVSSVMVLTLGKKKKNAAF